MCDRDATLGAVARAAVAPSRPTLAPGTRRVNSAATMAAYVARLEREIQPDAYWQLHNKYLSTYSIHSGTIMHDARVVAPPVIRKCHAWHLMRLARSKGVNVLGVTSEAKEGGAFLSDVSGGQPANVHYVDGHAFFGNHQSSIFALRKKDKVYYNDEDPLSVEALCAPL